jgi:hypothetical protein
MKASKQSGPAFSKILFFCKAMAHVKNNAQ